MIASLLLTSLAPAWAAASPALAQGPAAPALPLPEAPVPAASAPLEPAPAPRPRFDVAIGMGLSLESVGSPGPVPAFQLSAGVGGPQFGVRLRMVASQALGRYNPVTAADGPVDRVAVDALVTFRPARANAARAGSWLYAFERSFTLGAGPVIENVSNSRSSLFRLGLAFTAHVDVPLVWSADPTSSELGIRLAFRRMVAGDRQLNFIRVSDSHLEALAALAVTF